MDGFQGQENDIIIVSFVRSNNQGQLGFLNQSNRVCVALSRAKEGLYAVGNFDMYAKSSELWRRIRDTLLESEAIGNGIQVGCNCKKFHICDDEKTLRMAAGHQRSYCSCRPEIF